MPTEDWLKVVAFGCVHHPIADKETQAWRLDAIAKYNPDVVVMLGDWMDADAASRWENENEWTLMDEYRMTAADAEAVRKAAPRAKRIWVQGNHDDNLSAPGRIPKKLRDACSWQQNPELSKALANWKIVPYSHRAYYRVGQVTFQHGAETSMNADRNQSLLYGVENGLWVGAHTHRPVAITQVVLPGKIPLRRHFCNVGCGADWEKMSYIQRSNIATWGHGLLQVRVNAKRAAFSSRQWEADPGIVIRKMAHE